MRQSGKKILLLGTLWLATAAQAEVQTAVSMNIPALTPGRSAPFTAAQTSGVASSCAGTAALTYSGLTRFDLESGFNRFLTFIGTRRYGVPFDTFQLFQSFITPNFFTVVSSNTVCPSAQDYNFIKVRARSTDAPRLADDASKNTFTAGGTGYYNPTGSPIFTGEGSFDLAGPTESQLNYGLNPYSGRACSNGNRQTGATNSNMPLDQNGTMYFGNHDFIYISSGGNPVVAVGIPVATLSAPDMADQNAQVYTGLYTAYSSATSQIRKNIYLFPDALGTTFTLYESLSDTDPSARVLLGTIVCTQLNSPSNGFCSGTFSLNGVVETGPTAHAVCLVATTAPYLVACSAQQPGNHSVAVGLLATANNPALAVTLSTDLATTSSLNQTTTVTATITNLGGHPTTLSDPSDSNSRLQPPFSDAGAYTASNGTCRATLGGYSSCTVIINFNPSQYGTYLQTFRVTYDNGSGPTNATAILRGAGALASISVSASSGSIVQAGIPASFTATAHYTDGSTQNISPLVAWSSSDGTNISSTGVGTFNTGGTPTITASFAGLTGNAQVNVYTYASNGYEGGASAAAFGGTADNYLGYFATDRTRLVLAQSAIEYQYWDGAFTYVYPSFNIANPQTSVGFTYRYNSLNQASQVRVPFIDSSRRLFQTSTNGIQVWNSFPQSAVNPDAWIGTGPTGPTFSSSIRGIFAQGTKLIASDTDNNRVLIWKSFPATVPSSYNVDPDVVLGQPDLTHTWDNQTPSQPFYIADSLDNAIRYVDSRGKLSTVASGLGWPQGVATDSAGILYIADTNNHVIRKRDLSGTITIVAGTLNSSGGDGDGGPATSAHLNKPYGVAVDGSGNLYIADQLNSALRKVSTNGTITTLASFATTCGYSGSPTGVAVDGAGNAYVVLQNCGMVVKVNGGGTITSYATGMNRPYGVAIDYAGNLYVTDSGSNEIRKIDTNRTVTTVANVHAAGIAVDALGNLYYTNENELTSIVSRQSVSANTVVAGKIGNVGLFGDGGPAVSGSLQQPYGVALAPIPANTGTGAPTAQTLLRPGGVWTDGTRLIVADTGNNRVLVWNTFPTQNGQAADLVLGQYNMSSNVVSRSTDPNHCLMKLSDGLPKLA